MSFNNYDPITGTYFSVPYITQQPLFYQPNVIINPFQYNPNYVNPINNILPIQPYIAPNYQYQLMNQVPYNGTFNPFSIYNR